MKNKTKKTYSTIGKNKIIMIKTTNYQSKYINYNNSNNTSSNNSKQITTNLWVNTKWIKNKYCWNSTLSKYNNSTTKSYKYLDSSLYITKCFNYKIIYSHRCAPQERETPLYPSSWKIVKVQVNCKLRMINWINRERVKNWQRFNSNIHKLKK